MMDKTITFHFGIKAIFKAFSDLRGGEACTPPFSTLLHGLRSTCTHVCSPPLYLHEFSELEWNNSLWENKNKKYIHIQPSFRFLIKLYFLAQMLLMLVRKHTHFTHEGRKNVSGTKSMK